MSVLVVGAGSAGLTRHPLTEPGPDVHRLDAATADLLGVERAGSLLLHPDGRPAAARELLLQQAGAGDLRR
jgi:hypothetical protein